jgi:MFS transporter, SET family, sugar efflux transporter
MRALGAPSPKSFSVLLQVLSSPLYRGAAVAMCLSGLGISAAAPQIVFYMVKELGAPLPVAGLYYLTSLTAPIAGYIVGRHSDRTGERLALFRLCALAGFVGWGAIALSTKIWIACFRDHCRIGINCNDRRRGDPVQHQTGQRTGAGTEV